MKKAILIGVLLLTILSFATIVNAGTTLTLDKSTFLPGPNQTVKVYFNTDYPLYDDAWIGVIPSGVPHGPEKEGNDQLLTYAYASDKKYDSNSKAYVELEVPDTAGNYTVRLYSSDDPEKGTELASTPLTVGITTTTSTTTPTATNPQTGSTIGNTKMTLNQNSFLPGPNQTVKVYFTTDYPLFDDAWIGTVPSVVPHGPEKEGNDQLITYSYASDVKYDENSNKFVPLAVPENVGNYNVRLYSSDDPEKGVEVISVPLTVTTTPGTSTTGTTTPSTGTTGTTTPSTGTTGTTTTGTTTTGTGGGPVTIINNTTNINQNTNSTTNNANTSTNITGSTIANSNIASNNQTNQTTHNENAITVTQYVNVSVNGQPLQSDVKPFINADNRTMLPVRAIAEALGAEVQWDDATKTATLTLGTKNVQVPVGQNNILVDGNKFSMDTAAAIKDGRTLLPVRAIGEALGSKIGWDDQTKTVSIDKQ